MKMLDLEWSTTIHLVMILAEFFLGVSMYLNDMEDIKKKLLLYADDIVTVPETEAWNMAYFCLKIIVSDGNLL